MARLRLFSCRFALLAAGWFASISAVAQEVVFISDQVAPEVDAIQPVQLNAPQALPAKRQAAGGNNPAPEQAIVDSRVNDLFGSVDDVSGLSETRRIHARSPAADAVFGAQATGRQTSDVGNLLKEANSAHGVSNQNRAPLVNETRIRGQRVGQVLASGSYWAPVRMDLDTMVNKIDSRLIDDVILVKGPYSTRYGPGFRFVDMDFIHSPRYAGGFEAHGHSSATYQTNGEQWYGRQTIWGGSDTYGFNVSYGHRTGNDYETGQSGFFLPTSYKSRDVFIAAGWDMSSHQSIEVNVLRLDQTDVEFPGLVFDLNYLVTDGYEVTYTDTDPGFADHFVEEVWYNRTRFDGDTLRPGKNRQLPFLVNDLFSPSGNDGFAITDGDGLSAGHRAESTYELCDDSVLSLGTDVIFQNQELNDIEPLAPANNNNFPLPRSYSTDIGFYAERIRPVTEAFRVTTGVRGDMIFTDAVENVPGVPNTISDEFDSELDQQFPLWSTFFATELDLDCNWTATSGVGYAQRPPTLTELYVNDSFIGSLQRGQTFLLGDPQLNQEQCLQLDLGLRADYGVWKGGVHGYHAWIKDYITYDLYSPADPDFGFPQGAAFVNTDLATLTGAETYGQCQLTREWAMFGALSYVEGTDHSRTNAHRQGTDPRSGTAVPDKEALPGISPLESRVGFLIQDPSPRQKWGVELSARIVDDQDRIAATLEEITTPGFTTYDIRTYARKGSWLLTAGVENLTDKFYREHIDYRAGLGVFRPGINFYTGLEVAY